MVAVAIGSAIAGAYLDRQATKRANKNSRIATAKQMAFQREMSNTSYQRGMEDMKKAGLNPILAGKMGGASTPTGASYTAQKADPSGSAINSANSFMQNKQLAQNIGITKHAEKFANTTGIPIEHATGFAGNTLKATYSAKHMLTNGGKGKSITNKTKPPKTKQLKSKNKHYTYDKNNNKVYKPLRIRITPGNKPNKESWLQFKKRTFK